MVREGEWPDRWPDPSKYRGVHPISVLSKVLEGIVGDVFIKYLEAVGASGDTQWGFRVRHSCRDLVVLVTSTWILQLHAGNKIGVYASDISGAFDRVECKLMIRKLKAAGVHENLLKSRIVPPATSFNSNRRRSQVARSAFGKLCIFKKPG